MHGELVMVVVHASFKLRVLAYILLQMGFQFFDYNINNPGFVDILIKIINFIIVRHYYRYAMRSRISN